METALMETILRNLSEKLSSQSVIDAYYALILYVNKQNKVLLFTLIMAFVVLLAISAKMWLELRCLTKRIDELSNR